MNNKVLAVVVCGVLSLTAFNAIAAEEVKRAKVDIQTSDGIADILERYVGKYVIVRLVSGTEVIGRVAKVTTKVAYLTEIRGKEYYDSVIRIDQLAEINIRVREN